MGLMLSGVSKSSKAIAMSAASSLRAGITTLYRRANLAPVVLIIAGISFLVHVLVGANYGYFRDELYVMAMSQHPAFGYVDVPPLVPWITLIPPLAHRQCLMGHPCDIGPGLCRDNHPDRADGPAPGRHGVGPGTRCLRICDGPRPDGKWLNLHL